MNNVLTYSLFLESAAVLHECPKIRHYFFILLSRKGIFFYQRDEAYWDVNGEILFRFFRKLMVQRESSNHLVSLHIGGLGCHQGLERLPKIKSEIWSSGCLNQNNITLSSLKTKKENKQRIACLTTSLLKLYFNAFAQIILTLCVVPGNGARNVSRHFLTPLLEMNVKLIPGNGARNTCWHFLTPLLAMNVNLIPGNGARNALVIK